VPVSTSILEFKGVAKRYTLRQESAPVNGLLARLRSKPVEYFWALRDINFSVQAGQALGIIGHNGAGKSTLLKILSGITSPTEGIISLRGRMAGLLEVGSGFHPELTGRENIFLSGTILGMRRSEIHRKLEEIVDFAEIRPFIDIPVKRYSSGMYVRLGFSIAVHQQLDILLLDEVLAVGDHAFQRKCIERVQVLKNSGVTILFISHDLKAVEQTCARVLLLDKGRIIYDGLPSEAIQAYQRSRGSHFGVRRTQGPPPVEVQRVAFLTEQNQHTDHGTTGEPLHVELLFHAHAPMDNLAFHLLFYGPDGNLATDLNTRTELLSVPEGTAAIRFVCDPLCLPLGLYQVDTIIERVGASDPVEHVLGCAHLPVLSPQPVQGSFQQPCSWRLEQQ